MSGKRRKIEPGIMAGMPRGMQVALFRRGRLPAIDNFRKDGKKPEDEKKAGEKDQKTIEWMKKQNPLVILDKLSDDEIVRLAGCSKQDAHDIASLFLEHPGSFNDPNRDKIDRVISIINRIGRNGLPALKSAISRSRIRCYGEAELQEKLTGIFFGTWKNREDTDFADFFAKNLVKALIDKILILPIPDDNSLDVIGVYTPEGSDDANIIKGPLNAQDNCRIYLDILIGLGHELSMNEKSALCFLLDQNNHPARAEIAAKQIKNKSRSMELVDIVAKDENAFSYLIECLSHSMHELQPLIVRELGEIGNPSAMEPILKRIKYFSGSSSEKSEMVRESKTAFLKISKAAISKENVGIDGNHNVIDQLFELLDNETANSQYIGKPMGDYYVKKIIMDTICELLDTDPKVVWRKSDQQEQKIETMIRLLNDDEPLAGAAGKILSDLGEPAVEKLGALLQYDSQIPNKHVMKDARIRAARALGDTCLESATEYLWQGLLDEDWEIRLISAEALGKSRHEPSINKLKETLDDEHESVARMAAKSIKELSKLDSSRTKKYLNCKEKILCGFLLGDKPETFGLDSEEKKKLDKFTKKFLQHKHLIVRVNALGNLAVNDKNIKYLKSAIRDQDEVREAAMALLLKNPTQSAIETLIGSLGRDSLARDLLVHYHQRFDRQGDELEPVLEMVNSAAVKSNFPKIRSECLILSELMNGSASVPLVINAAKRDRAKQVRRTALSILAKGEYRLGNIQVFVDALGDHSEDVKLFAVEQLVQFEKKGYDEAVSALKKGSPQVRKGAVFVIARFYDPKSVPILINALEDRDEEVRIESSQAIAFLISVYPDSEIKADAVPGLVSVLRNKDEFVRDNVKTLLQEILDKCDTAKEAEEYLGHVRDGRKNLRGFFGKIVDKAKKDEALATKRAEEILDDFLSQAVQKKDDLNGNGANGPYR